MQSVLRRVIHLLLYFRAASKAKLSEDEEYPFVEQPSDDFFCPVTRDLLLQPHLTSCCGKHLSQEAATRIQREGGACPLCKTPQWSTMLSKHFQRLVNALCVFCRHEDRGCGWRGELSDFNHHLQSCPMRYAPLMTELLKLPLYVSNVLLQLYRCLAVLDMMVELQTQKPGLWLM